MNFKFFCFLILSFFSIPVFSESEGIKYGDSSAGALRNGFNVIEWKVEHIKNRKHLLVNFEHGPYAKINKIGCEPVGKCRLEDKSKSMALFNIDPHVKRVRWYLQGIIEDKNQEPVKGEKTFNLRTEELTGRIYRKCFSPIGEFNGDNKKSLLNCDPKRPDSGCLCYAEKEKKYYSMKVIAGINSLTLDFIKPITCLSNCENISIFNYKCPAWKQMDFRGCEFLVIEKEK